MNESYKQNLNDENPISQRLNQMPKLSAPARFEHKLMHNIQRLERGEAVKIIQADSFNWKTTSLSIAAGLTIAIVGFGSQINTVEPVNNASPAIVKENEVDSTKEMKQFDKPVNLVNDKKK